MDPRRTAATHRRCGAGSRRGRATCRRRTSPGRRRPRPPAWPPASPVRLLEAGPASSGPTCRSRRRSALDRGVARRARARARAAPRAAPGRSGCGWSPSPPCSSARRSGIETVPDAAHAVDVARPPGALLEPPPQRDDDVVDHPGVGVVGQLPDLGQELAARNDLG